MAVGFIDVDGVAHDTFLQSVFQHLKSSAHRMSL